MVNQSRSIPATTQRFRRFERVQLYGLGQARFQHLGDCVGTVIWADPPQKATGQWSYCVRLNAHRQYLSVLESNLRTTGEFGAEDEFLGTTFEISHDLLPDEDGSFSFVEGTYRLPGRFWQVMIFHQNEVPAVRHRMGSWKSGITGIVFDVPEEFRLDKSSVEQAMSEAFGVEQWIEVEGPDSMILR